VESKLFQPCIKEREVLDFFNMRREKLDAVVITGGEPTIHDGLALFIKQIKKMGFAVKLDTNGSQPQVIKNLLDEKLLDFIAMDIKAPLEKYKDIVKTQINPDSIKESIRLILKAKIPYEFRTTVVASQLEEKDILQIGKMIAGAKHYVLQKFVPAKTLDKRFLKELSYSDEKFQKIRNRLEHKLHSVRVRL
jgi:pyruvate formate lyase activating enzyme